jgi:hypothetical protein
MRLSQRKELRGEHGGQDWRAPPEKVSERS